MKVKYCLFLLLLFLSGCVKVHLPEHLVSDSVKAGTDLYHNITAPDDVVDSVDNNASQNNNIVFTHTYIGEIDEAEDVLKNKCLNELEADAISKFALTTLAYKVVSEKINKSISNSVVTCKVRIL